MKKSILLTFISLFTLLSSLLVTPLANAYWYYDGYGYVSNVCRYGGMWQTVSYHYVGTDCYMSGWGVWGKRTAE